MEPNILNQDDNSFPDSFDFTVYYMNNDNLVEEIKGSTIADRIDFDHTPTLFSK